MATMDSFTALAVFRNDYKDPGYFVSLEELAYAVRFGNRKIYKMAGSEILQAGHGDNAASL